MARSRMVKYGIMAVLGDRVSFSQACSKREALAELSTQPDLKLRVVYDLHYGTLIKIQCPGMPKGVAPWEP